MLGIKEILIHPVTLAAVCGVIAWAMMILDSRAGGKEKTAGTYVKNVSLVFLLVFAVCYLLMWCRQSPDVILGEPDF